MVDAIITHTDMDGAGAAGLYLYLNNKPEHRIFYTEPYLLNKTLRKTLSAYYEKILLFDLGVNPSVFSEVLSYLKLLVRNNSKIYWFDHHVWNEKWISEVQSIGVELFLDQSTCATGVVAKYVKPTRAGISRDFIENIVGGICAGDLWRFDHWLGAYYIRLIRRKDPNQWRKNVIKRIADGEYWCDEFESKILDHLERELSYFRDDLPLLVKNIHDVRVVITESNEIVENSFLAAYLIGRYDADIAVLVSTDGKLSFRSRSFNVRELALRLGGGGHIHASGAKLDVPWWIRFASRFSKKILLIYTAELVSKAIKELY